MKLLFVLSKEDISLAKEEVLALANTKKFELIDNLLILDGKNIEIFKRLAYTHNVYQFLFSCKKNELKNKIKKYNFDKIYEKNYCVRKFGKSKHNEKELGSFVWHRLKKPKVNVKNPKTEFHFYFAKKVVAGRLLYEIEKSFEERKAHLRPEPHPSSLHPKLARAMVNLTGIKKGVILDPFCGSGGILIEAGLMKLRIIGYDIDRIMLNRTKINLEFYKIKEYKLKHKNAVDIDDKADAIVTDLPYGRNTKINEFEKTIKEFLKNAYKFTNIAAIGFPDFVDYQKLLGKLKIKKSFSYYLHKSLSKKIIILRK